jgi:hypothetical protein
MIWVQQARSTEMTKQLIQSANGTIHLIERSYQSQSGATVYVACRMVRGTLIDSGTVTCKRCAQKER